jgi:uncharacterized lipoprotein YajG
MKITKTKLMVYFLCVFLAVAGCSTGSKSNTPEEKIATINTMMSKGYEMSRNQKAAITMQLEDGRNLLAQGKTAEANKQFDNAIKMLEIIAESDRFNKSE